VKFEEFWNSLKKELQTKKEFSTLTQNKNFTAYLEGGYSIIIAPELSESRLKLKPQDMRYVWNIAKNIPVPERFSVIHYNRKIRTASYAVVFLKHFLKDNNME
jgi:hypothetical protein